MDYIPFALKQLHITINYEVAHTDIDLHTVGTYTGTNCFGHVGPHQCRVNRHGQLKSIN